MVDTGKPVTEAPVTLAKDRDSVVLMPASQISALLPDDFALDQVQVTYTVQQDITAPIAKGDVLGSASYSYNGRDYGTVDLVAALSIERSQTLYMLHRVKLFVNSTTFKIGVACFVGLILLVIIALVIHHKRAQKRRYSSVRRSR
jgi:D-alanyl-D-alanine carboxypeptidase (penicillin-binding protein 5/6)